MLIHAIHKNKFNTFSFIKFNVIADKLKLDINEEKITHMINNDKDIEIYKRKYNIRKIDFHFANSKRYGGLKFSDFIAGIIRKKYILEYNNLPNEFIECFIGKVIIT